MKTRSWQKTGWQNGLDGKWWENIAEELYGWDASEWIEEKLDNRLWSVLFRWTTLVVGSTIGLAIKGRRRRKKKEKKKNSNN
ncbi:MAG: hypothetical protein GF308_19855 [Candidatus Heimdallarchaeota archaeon]|nr:hypothetical protein [Candidatus Heimdallarchaeota archaeon]